MTGERRRVYLGKCQVCERPVEILRVEENDRGVYTMEVKPCSRCRRESYEQGHSEGYREACDNYEYGIQGKGGEE